VRDELWEEFVKSWGEPIPKLALARHGWERVATDKRPRAVAGAKGYWAWLRAHKKPPAAISAQAFLRDEGGWEQWLRYVPSADGSPPPGVLASYPLASPEGRALCTLYESAGLGHFLRSVIVHGNVAYYSRPINARLLAMAQAPDRKAWLGVSRQGAGAWEDFFAQVIVARRFRRVAEGDCLPWPFPPSREGKIYDATTATGPPFVAGTLMTEDDMQEQI